MNKYNIRSAVLFILFLVLLTFHLYCQQTKKIYIANDTHTDYMWVANEDSYRHAFLDMLDYYLDLADSTSQNDPAYQSRFNCDGSFWIWIYENNKTRTEFIRLIDKIRSGHITVPLNLLNLCYGGMPAEAVFRSMYYSGQLERRYNLRFRLATAQENQTIPFGLGALWAGSGAQYSWKGICGCASRIYDAWDRQHDMYWWVGPDNSRLLMKWNSMLRNYYDLGGYAEANNIPETIDYVDSNPDFISRHPYSTIGIFGYGGDSLIEKTDKFIQIAQQKTTAARKVIVSNQIDFFEEFENKHGNSLPSLSCSYGNEWDLLIASMAELSARVKRAIEKLRAAEALASLVSLQDPMFMRNRESSRNQAWLSLGLYFDHDWTADGPISRNERAQWQRRKAAEFDDYVEQLYQDGVESLGQMIRKDGSLPRFFVFNPLSWSRTDFADFPYSGQSQVHVMDLSTNQESPFQLVERNGIQYIRILAEDIPSVGYKVFEIIPGSGTVFSGGPLADGNTIENSFYKITLADNGAITGLVDKIRGNRQMVRKINQHYMNDLGPGSGSLTIIDQGPVCATLKAVSPAPLAHNTYITLFRDSSRIDIRNEIDQNFSGIHTWKFGFNLDAPEIWHEEVGAVIKADFVQQGGHYSPRNARYDWLTLNHFADISSGAIGVTLSNRDCYFMQTGNSTTEHLDTLTPQISVLAGGQVDGDGLGIPNQGNDTFFLQRFALQTHGAFVASKSARFALEHQNPLVTGAVAGGTYYPRDFFSLLEIDHPDIALWAVKPAEDTTQNNIIIRLWNLSFSPVDFELKFLGYSILESHRTTHIETPIEAVIHENSHLAVSIAPHQWLTFSLKMDGIPSPGKGIRKGIR